MKTFLYLIFAASLGLVIVPSSVRAGPVWSLQWEFGSNALISDSGRSAVLFTPHNSTSSAANTTVVVANVGVTSYTQPGHLDPITRQNYGMLLKLTDLASHVSHYFWFAGSLTGTISQHTANLANHFSQPSSYANIRLGNDIYNIRIGPFNTPSWNNHFNGVLDAFVSYRPVVNKPHVAAAVVGAVAPMDQMGTPTLPPGGVGMNPTPEPSSLLLGCLGLALGGIPVGGAAAV